jgi:protein-tyrosine phosphatase
MEQVASNLYVGGLDAAGSPELLTSEGITAVLKLTHSAPESPYPEPVTVADRPLVDGPRNDVENFRDAVGRLTTLLEAGETVLVHCSAGSSRSGAVAAAALARRDDVDVETALARIEREKPDVDPHPALREHARQVVR